jgi:hypothetical protein
MNVVDQLRRVAERACFSEKGFDLRAAAVAELRVAADRRQIKLHRRRRLSGSIEA